MAVESRRQTGAMTLSDQLAVPDSPDLRDLLRSHNSSRCRRRLLVGGGRGESLTLSSIIAADKRDAPAAAVGRSRTLLDVLQDDEEGEPSEGRALRPRRGGAAWTAPSGRPDAASLPSTGDLVPSPPPEPVITTLEVILGEHQPAGEPVITTLEVILGEHQPAGEPVEEADLTERPARLSLMALLEQTEWPEGVRSGIVPAAVPVMEEEEEEEEEEEVVEMVVEEGEAHVCRCCVCMARRKGAAFIPCGHTFCRRCSRELWVRRGSCPLCNAAIGDILDIF